MLFTAEKISYQAFGLEIASDILLQELSITDNAKEKEADVVIENGDLQRLWTELAAPNKYYLVSGNIIMFYVPDVAIYAIENGRKIIVSPLPGSSADKVCLYILGTCMGALLLQRRILPLHGSAIAVNGKAYAFIGDSGAGKSTLASALIREGYQLISDDVIPVSLSMGNIPVVTPSYPQQKLWQESLYAFGIESKGLRPIVERESKFAVPVHSQFADQSLPLAGVFELVKTEKESIVIQPLYNLERLQTLFHHTYRNFLLAPSGLLQWHFAFTATIANNVHLYQIQRPVSQFTANEIASLILSKIKED